MPKNNSGKSWPDILDGWMRSRQIRRDLMIFICVVLVLLLTGLVLSAHPMSVLIRIFASPATWVTGGGLTLGSGWAALRRYRRRRRNRTVPPPDQETRGHREGR